MTLYEILQKKRDGYALGKDEIEFFIKAVTDGTAKDYHIAAMMMAMYIQGLDSRETADLTIACARSGETLDLGGFGITADKHSTGGVGDKTTFICAPIAAAAGLTVAKMSGKGLGHTGGTVDKAMSIPGFKTDLSTSEFLDILKKTKFCLAGQSKDLAPADKRLYAVRDVTATVSYIPLIAASIMGKKLASGAENMVLDVKCGSGAFMKTLADARELSKVMIDIAKTAGKKCVCVITDMSVPLGQNVGNSLEIIEVTEVLSGGGAQDLREISLTLSAEMLATGLNLDIKQAYKKAEETLNSKKALAKFIETVKMQGGDVSYITDTSKFPKAKYSVDIVSRRDGFAGLMDSEKIGRAAVMLGAGRINAEDAIDYSAGLKIYKKTGDAIKAGDKLFTLYAVREKLFAEAAKLCEDSFDITHEKVQRPPLVLEILRGSP